MKNNRCGPKGGRGDPPWIFGSRGDPPIVTGARGQPPWTFGARGDPPLIFEARGDPPEIKNNRSSPNINGLNFRTIGCRYWPDGRGMPEREGFGFAGYGLRDSGYGLRVTGYATSLNRASLRTKRSNPSIEKIAFPMDRDKLCLAMTGTG
jgi:hypothetical protein